MYKFLVKPIVDFLLAFAGLIILSPIFLFITCFLFFANRGKPFFFQDRVGLGEKVFKIIKFKTMNDKKDEKGNLLPEEERVTKIGDLIRKSSLDEIPQLLNVLSGNMSLIGPRPLLVLYLEFYNEEQRRRHEVRPGITGWAQINGRNSISWSDKFKLDVYYIDNLSPWLDLKILFLTVLKVLKREGVNAEKETFVQKFDGTN